VFKDSSAVVLKVGTAVLWGPRDNFLGTAKHLPKNQHASAPVTLIQ